MKATIIGFDIKQYSGSENITEMDTKRDILRTALQECIKSYPEIENGFNNAGTPDTGDGCYIIVDSGNFKSILKFLEDMAICLSNQNIIRLRAVVHRDIVEETENINVKSKTWIGGINACARYLDSEPLKSLIDLNEKSNFVHGLSQEFINDAIDEINFSNYEYFWFRTKDYTNKIYLKISDEMKLPEKNEFLKLINLTLDEKHKCFLEKCDFVYPDKSKHNNLSTFFVYPYLLYKKLNNKNNSKIDAKNLINNYIIHKGKILILGDEQTGKTSLAKKYFLDLFNSNKFLPIYISCKKGVPKLYENLIQKNFKKQYNENYSTELDEYTVLILDNFNLWNDMQQKKVH